MSKKEKKGGLFSRIKEFIHREWTTFKSLDKEGKKHFLYDYYRIPIGVLVFILIVILAEVFYSMGQGKVGVNVVMINSADVETDAFDVLLGKTGADTKKYHADVNTMYKYDESSTMMAMENQSTTEVLATLFGIGDLDIFVANKEVFDRYATKDAFEDLSLVLGEEVLKGHEADLYTYTTDDGLVVTGGIWLREGSFLHQAGYYDGDVLIGVAQGALNLTNALNLLKVILTEQ